MQDSELYKRLKKNVMLKIEDIIKQLQELDQTPIKAYLDFPPEQHPAHWQKVKADTEKVAELRMLAKTYALILIPDDVQALLDRLSQVASEKQKQIIPDEVNKEVDLGK